MYQALAFLSKHFTTKEYDLEIEMIEPQRKKRVFYFQNLPQKNQ